MDLEGKSFEELEKWVTEWMESHKPDMEFYSDKNGTYMYTSPYGNSKINLKYFFTSVLEDYLDEQRELRVGNPSNEGRALPIAGVGGAEGDPLSCPICKSPRLYSDSDGYKDCYDCGWDSAT